MTIRILGIEKSEKLIYDLGRYLTRSKIMQMNIPTGYRNFLISHNDIEFFKSQKTADQVKKINQIKDNFDLCIVSGWDAATIAYLSGLKYIIFFMGDDIKIPPFVKNSKPDFLNEPVNKYNFLQRKFYKHILNNALACVTGSEEMISYLKKYRKDAYRIDGFVANTSLFNPTVKPIDLKKNTFTFFSPQRIGLEKGTDVLWKAISLCKSDFEVIQVEWFDEKSPEAKRTSNELLKIKPSKVRLIPLIKLVDMPKYYAFADAVLGEMKTGHLNYTECEAILCKKPVITYNDPKWKHLAAGKEISSPFLPTSQDPLQIAELIDKVVESRDFREKLIETEYDFIMKMADPVKKAEEWDDFFEIVYKQQKSTKKNIPFFIRWFRMIFFYICQ
ncbi:MAG: glycosyltransferase [Nitrosotalea sp.]